MHIYFLDVTRLGYFPYWT